MNQWFLKRLVFVRWRLPDVETIAGYRAEAIMDGREEGKAWEGSFT